MLLIFGNSCVVYDIINLRRRVHRRIANDRRAPKSVPNPIGLHFYENPIFNKPRVAYNTYIIKRVMCII